MTTKKEKDKTRPLIRPDEGSSFSDILKPKKRGRGRPRLPSWDEILPWSDIIGSEAVTYVDAQSAMWRWQRQHQGRPPNNAANQELLEDWRAAESQGMNKQAFLKKRFRKCYGREAKLDDDKDVIELRSMERQLNRLLPNNEKLSNRQRLGPKER
jgi:hypothetical protein